MTCSNGSPVCDERSTSSRAQWNQLAPWLQWHLGFYQRAYTPLERRFDEHLGYYQGCVDYYTHTGGGYGGMKPGTGE